MKKQILWKIAGAGFALALTATTVWAQTDTTTTAPESPAVTAPESPPAAETTAPEAEAPATEAPAAEAPAAEAPAAEEPAAPSATAAALDEATASTSFVFNTLLFLIGGFLVMFMAAGFAMLEAGLVRSKNAAMQCLKNIALYSIAGIMFWLLGYNLMYENVNVADNIAELSGYMGTWSMKMIPEPSADSGDYAAASDWFFQMVFCATTASIVSGTIAERMRLWPFLIFTVVLTGIIYPITGSWEWGGGWLDQMGFSDFAGSTLVHSVGGWAALAGAIVVGARHGKFGENGVIHPMPGSSIPLATLGTFILWLGWFGFNGASQLALGTIADASSVAKIFVNTNTAAAAGVIVCVVLTQLFYRKVDVTMALNGALAGLVSITAEPLTPTMAQAALIGGIGGVFVVVFVPLLDKIRIDDVVGAIPVHLVCGIWGTMIVPLSNGDATYYVQFIGVVSIGAAVFFASLIVWLILAAVTGLRATPEEEAIGLDTTEVGVHAYPEFGASRA
ncbi:ammonium transporter [Acuticoccus sp. M5D2P5]|uniref:ammonium transporter n=1 Tax=Acuticoccus kalidii TaxID=2910977 RepID=UPI001F16AB51|nr:ammonium transporter [Acuticoccus kalidii]MCF3933950.1 ammonium transporter [Acuticoccus kalidii]